MKQQLIASGLILAATLSPLSLAAETPEQPAPSAKKGAVMASSILGGAALAGPIGALVGMIGGAFMVNDVEKADQLDEVTIEMAATAEALDSANQRVGDLQEQLLLAGYQQRKLEDMALTSLEFQILFHTGADELTPSAAKRLHELAVFLKDNPELQILVQGYADPRGTDEYNNVLSLHRALNVKQALVQQGVELERIQYNAYGADQSMAGKGDLDAYAAERRVSIEIFHRGEGVVHIEP